MRVVKKKATKNNAVKNKIRAIVKKKTKKKTEHLVRVCDLAFTTGKIYAITIDYVSYICVACTIQVVLS